jgi:hypothetical protein
MLSRIGTNLAWLLTAVTCIWPMLVDVILSIKYSDMTCHNGDSCHSHSYTTCLTTVCSTFLTVVVLNRFDAFDEIW